MVNKISIKEITVGSQILARYIPATAAWEDGLNFFSNDEEFIQVGTWGYGDGKELSAHKHNKFIRETDWTQEVLFIKQGKILVTVYDDNDIKIEEWVASSGDIIIMLSGGHGYKVLDDNTQVLEVKNGPYLGADKDRKRL